ncbi:MAG TPA: tRNA (adenosine(37)-N6)-threonylcarbamoyltransferase complex ATPase subunit type 1 TsaE [Chitinophagales bacterium]|nr:tRNA (adenosine(37)-N6)-threonylcarbamoyltransferase complex ATPase subunit type 1 TsaE [Chitinophagales bacterium]
MSFQITIHHLDELRAAVKTILKGCPGKKVFAFYGELGAGKTTMIQALCEELGVKEKTVSPTFAIVNEYQGTEKIFHIDLYRLNNLSEALDIGIEEYLASGNYCFIEWAELIKDLLPEDTVMIEIEVKRNGERRVEVINSDESGEK